MSRAGAVPAGPSHGSKQAMSLMPPAGRAAHRGRTRSPVRMAAAEPASTACSIAVSAPSSRISAQANGSASGWPASGSGIQDQLTTVPQDAPLGQGGHELAQHRPERAGVVELDLQRRPRGRALGKRLTHPADYRTCSIFDL